MYRHRHGEALVISVVTGREGSEHDDYNVRRFVREYMDMRLYDLHRDPTWDDVDRAVQGVLSAVRERYDNPPPGEDWFNDCFVCFIMAHGCRQGGQDTFELADGKTMTVMDIARRFSEDNCPALKGKPKVRARRACACHCPHANLRLSATAFPLCHLRNRDVHVHRFSS